MALVTRARIAGILAMCLLMVGAPVAAGGVPESPDAMIRPGWNPSYVGDEVNSLDAAGQAVSNSGVVGQKLTFFIKIQNDSCCIVDTFKVKRSGSFHEGYRVRYYDAMNNDVTGQVNTGTFTTPLLVSHDEYVMRATVKIRPQATACSFVTRLMTITRTSTGDKDAVRFTAALAGPNCPPVAFNDKASITENQVSVSGNLFANDIDPDGDLLFFDSLAPVPPLYGNLIPTGGGGYDWFLNNADLTVNALNNGQTLTQVVTYVIQDSFGGPPFSNTATLTITIHGVTDPD